MPGNYRPEQGNMRPHTLAFVAGVVLMALVFFAWLGQYCPTCAVEDDWGTWGLWLVMFAIGAALTAVGLWRGAKKP